MNLTDSQRKMFGSLLDDYDNRLSNDSCNDMMLPNTKENREMLAAAHVWNCKGLTQEAKECIASEQRYERVDLFGNPFEKEICTNNGLILGYLRHLAGL